MKIKVLRYMYYRMYKAYEAKNDSPVLRAFMYISLCHIVIVGLLVIYLERIVNLVGFDLRQFLPEINPWLFAIPFLFVILICSYLIYCRKSMEYYEGLFESRIWLNSHIKIWMLVICPFFVFFSGAFLNVVLFGGQILGDKYVGVICLIIAR
jgi:hypothetical protein